MKNCESGRTPADWGHGEAGMSSWTHRVAPWGASIDSALALVTGIGLWTVLPRGVVLTRSTRTIDWRGEAVCDTWELRNESALYIQLTSVTVMGVSTIDEVSGHLRFVELTPDNERVLGVYLTFVDSHLRPRDANATFRGKKPKSLLASSSWLTS